MWCSLRLAPINSSQPTAWEGCTLARLPTLYCWQQLSKWAIHAYNYIPINLVKLVAGEYRVVLAHTKWWLHYCMPWGLRPTKASHCAAPCLAKQTVLYNSWVTHKYLKKHITWLVGVLSHQPQCWWRKKHQQLQCSNTTYTVYWQWLSMHRVWELWLYWCTT